LKTEFILLAVAPAGLAVLLAWIFPRLSRNVLGPATIVISIVAFLIILNQSDLGRDAWGPARAVIALFVGAVGIIAGLVLITLGAVLSKQDRGQRSESPQPYSAERPYRLPGPGLFTPKRLFIAIVGPAIVVFAVLCVYAWVV
jgi:hypothetical protein